MAVDTLSATFAALADPTRRAILARLAGGSATVSELAAPFAISGPAVSKHLGVLERAGLITRGRQAQWRPCRLEAAPLRDVSEWAEGYRPFWDASHARLDGYLHEMQDHATTRRFTMGTSTSGTTRDGALTLSTPSDTEATITRVFDAPRHLVFEAHTRPEHVQRWMLGPDGWTMPVCEMDVRPGGAWHCVWRRTDGTELEMTGTYLEVSPPDRIVQTENWGGDWPETVNTLVLTEHDGRTTLTLTIAYPTTEARDAAMGSGMDDGATATYDRLAALLVVLLARLTGGGSASPSPAGSA